MAAMTTTDYLINAVFVLIVLRQARERELDRRSVIIPLAVLAYVAQLYVRSIPTAGNDLVLVAALGTVGLTLGVASGLATHVRAGENGLARRTGRLDRRRAVDRWDRLADGVRVRDPPRRRHAVASFSMAHQIGAAAWPVALVLMALLEVGTRIAIVQLRGRRAMQATRRRDPCRGMSGDVPDQAFRPARSGPDRRSIVRTAVTESQPASAPDSERVAEAERALRSGCIASAGRCGRSAGR